MTQSACHKCVKHSAATSLSPETLLAAINTLDVVIERPLVRDSPGLHHRRGARRPRRARNSRPSPKPSQPTDTGRRRYVRTNRDLRPPRCTAAITA
jgi:hypothetical protein